MKAALKLISAFVGILILIGFFTREETSILRHALPAGMLAFAFLWMPFFLFYRYDQKTYQKEKREEAANDPIERN